MPITVLFYITLFLSCVAGSIFINPLIGIWGYLVTYHIDPMNHWWSAYLPGAMERYSLILGIATLTGFIFHKSKFEYNRTFESQELLLICYIIFCWLSIIVGVETRNVDWQITKMTKLAIMLLIATRVITNIKKYETIVYLYILSGLFLGLETYFAPRWAFTDGRLDVGIGGSDFGNGNMLAGHFIIVLSLIGVMFLSKGWKTKILCFASGAFIMNGIVLIRSRGSFFGLLVGLVTAVVFSNSNSRKKIILCLVIGTLGSCLLINQKFLDRMQLIKTDTEEMDLSAKSRVDMWKAAIDMVLDNPFGVGVGNFTRVAPRYTLSYNGLDAHNTYLKCLSELGWHGLIVLLVMIVNGYRILSCLTKRIENVKAREIYYWHITGAKIALLSYIVTIVFISATYREDLFWLLMFPVLLKRAVDNEISNTENGLYQSSSTVITF